MWRRCMQERKVKKKIIACNGPPSANSFCFFTFQKFCPLLEREMRGRTSSRKCWKRANEGLLSHPQPLGTGRRIGAMHLQCSCLHLLRTCTVQRCELRGSTCDFYLGHAWYLPQMDGLGRNALIFLPQRTLSICYSAKDIFLFRSRGYSVFSFLSLQVVCQGCMCHCIFTNTFGEGINKAQDCAKTNLFFRFCRCWWSESNSCLFDLLNNVMYKITNTTFNHSLTEKALSAIRFLLANNVPKTYWMEKENMILCCT